MATWKENLTLKSPSQAWTGTASVWGKAGVILFYLFLAVYQLRATLVVISPSTFSFFNPVVAGDENDPNSEDQQFIVLFWSARLLYIYVFFFNLVIFYIGYGLNTAILNFVSLMGVLVTNVIALLQLQSILDEDQDDSVQTAIDSFIEVFFPFEAPFYVIALLAVTLCLVDKQCSKSSKNIQLSEVEEEIGTSGPLEQQTV